MSLINGSRLGPYEIIAPLGVGAMGEVYRARDSRLQREVALKVLPTSVAEDPDRLARFQREAQVLASLNHTNIAHIHGLEESGSLRALVMELVEGDDLSSRIARGAIPLDEALPIAKQIAEALEAAHDQGIIHRDLKPANIKVRLDGTAKVLDFGLAKALDPAGGSNADATSSPTITSSATKPGMILGTPAYMSPEQARGRPLDRRADIWAFGCVICEMLTGRPAFPGDSIADVLSSVVKEPPDLMGLPPDTPHTIRRLLSRCLEKDPRERLRDIGDARIELGEALSRSGGMAQDTAGSRGSADAPVLSISESAASRTSRRVVWALGLLTIASILLAAVQTWRAANPRGTTSGEPVHFSIGHPGISITEAAVSPDGRRLALVGSVEGGEPLAWIRTLDNARITPITGTEGALRLFWSPDGSQIGYSSSRGLMAVNLSSGISRTISSSFPAPYGRSWGAGGSLLGGSVAGLVRLSEGGGDTSALGPAGPVGWPAFLPDGHHFFIMASVLQGGPGNKYGIYLSSIDKPAERRLLVPLPSAPACAAGHLLFVKDGTLMAQAFDPTRLELTGEAVPIVDGVWYFRPNGQAVFSAAGDTVTYMTRPPDIDLLWADAHGSPIGSMGTPGQYGLVAVSPDGTRIVAYRLDRRVGTGDLFLFDPKRQTSAKLTDDEWSESFVTWSHDGKRIAFASDRSGPPDVYVQDVDSGEAAKLVWSTPDVDYPRGWLPDGRLLVYSAADGGRHSVVTPGEKPTAAPLDPPLPRGSADAAVSPDGRWIASVSRESGRNEIYMQPLGRPGPRVRVSASGGVAPVWRRDGGELYFASGRSIVSVPVRPGSSFSSGSPAILFSMDRSIVDFDVTADGPRFLIIPGPPQDFLPFHVLVNWPARVKH